MDWYELENWNPYLLNIHNVCLPVGLYNSTIISCDFGDNVVSIMSIICRIISLVMK